MTSLTLWQQLYNRPGDDTLWKRFDRHYRDRIYYWAVRSLHGEAGIAAEITVEVFRKVYNLISDPDAKRVTPRNNSFASYIRAVVDNTCKDFQRQQGAEARRNEALWTQLGREEALGYLDRVIEDAEEAEALERAMAELAQLFKTAVRQWKWTQPKYKKDGKLWAVFLAAFGTEPYPGLSAELDARFGFPTRWEAFRKANGVAAALCRYMDLPFESDKDRDRSKYILRELVKRHGDPSE